MTPKFRIWDIKTKEFHFSGGTPMMLSQFFRMTAVLNTRDGQPYEQYTGRNDDSEKVIEVYDGNKIKITIQDGEGIEEYQHHEYGTVVWSELDLVWCVTFDDDKFPELLSEYQEIEVIGTIHDKEK